MNSPEGQVEMEKWRSTRTELWGTPNTLYRHPRRGKHEPRSKKMWDQLVALLLADYIILGESLAHSRYQFPYVSNIP